MEIKKSVIHQVNTDLSCNMSVASWYENATPEFFVQQRCLKSLTMFEYQQTSCYHVSPKTGSFVLQCINQGGYPEKIDLGVGALNGKWMTGSFILAPPMVNSTYEMVGRTSGLAFELERETISQLTDELGSCTSEDFGRLHAQYWRNKTLRDLVFLIWRAAKGDKDAPSIDPDEALMRLIVLLVRQSTSSVQADQQTYALSPTIRRRISDYIHTNCGRDLGLFHLAEVSGLSPYHFARAFRSDFGFTPHGYVLDCRLKRARHLLLKSKMPLADIALECGFASQQHLTTSFTKYEGVTPGRVRRTGLL